MSGSSLDGLDIVYTKFEENDGIWTYQILKASTAKFPRKWQLRISRLVLQNAINYLKTDVFLGHYFGELVVEFIREHNIDRDDIDFVASHGQTVFHQPDNKLTSQIGDGAAIAVETGLPVICEFRTIDIALGGQGTPIVPIGEKHLFSDHRFFLNIGGICNISTKLDNGDFVAFDSCAANMVLNKLANEVDMEYDKDGTIASKGKLNQELLGDLSGSWYFEREYPKSLSGGWVSRVLLPVIKRHWIPVEDKMRTVCEHVAVQLSKDLEMVLRKEDIHPEKEEKIFTTGGGALNGFLIKCINEHSPIPVYVPDEETVQFKEALIIAFMGVLRYKNKINVLSSVTGAKRDTIGGVIFQGASKILV